MIIVGENSYVSEEDAEAYIAAYGSPNSPPSVSEQDLIQATLAIDRIYGERFRGVSVGEQSLYFPLTGTTAIPTRVAQATVEMALLLADGEIDVYGRPNPVITEITEELQGAVRETIKYGSGGNYVDPLHKITLILGPLLLNSTSSSGWGLSFIDVVPGI